MELLSHAVILLLSLSLALWPLKATVPLLGMRWSVVSFALFILAGLSFCIKKRIRIPALSIWGPALVFVVLHVLSFFLYSRGYGPETGVDLPTHHLIKFLLSLLFYFLILTLFQQKNPMREKIILLTLTWTSIISLVLIFRHLFIFHSYYLTQFFSVAGFQNEGYAFKNQLAFFFSLLFPFAYSYATNRRQWFSWILLILLGFATLYTLSRMAFILVSLTPFLFCLVAYQKKKYLIQFLILIGVVLTSTFFGLGPKQFLELKYKGQVRSTVEGGKSMTLKANELGWQMNPQGSRAKYLRSALQGFWEKPIFGHGFDTFAGDHTEFGKQGERLRFPSSHNDYGQILYELGLVGFISFFYLLGFSCKRMFVVRSLIPLESQWLWEGQMVSFFVLCISLFAINAYYTIPFWFILAGNNAPLKDQSGLSS